MIKTILQIDDTNNSDFIIRFKIDTNINKYVIWFYNSKTKKSKFYKYPLLATDNASSYSGIKTDRLFFFLNEIAKLVKEQRKV